MFVNVDKFYCVDCGRELIADTVTNSGSDWCCPKCDDTVWKKSARSRTIKIKIADKELERVRRGGW